MDKNLNKTNNAINKDADEIISLPKVSICIPVYNRSKYLYECINSALSQNYENLEVIIGDDNSDDETTLNIINGFLKNKRVRYYKNNENLGINRNYERLIDFSEGEWLVLLSNDDYFTDNTFISQAIDRVKNIPNASVLCGGYRTITENELGKVEERFDYTDGIFSGREFFLKGFDGFWPDFCICDMLMKKSAIRGTKLNSFIYSSPDFYFFMLLCLAGDVYVLSKPFLMYRYHDKNYSDCVSETDLYSKYVYDSIIPILFYMKLKKKEIFNKQVLYKWLIKNLVIYIRRNILWDRFPAMKAAYESALVKMGFSVNEFGLNSLFNKLSEIKLFEEEILNESADLSSDMRHTKKELESIGGFPYHYTIKQGLENAGFERSIVGDFLNIFVYSAVYMSLPYRIDDTGLNRFSCFGSLERINNFSKWQELTVSDMRIDILGDGWMLAVNNSGNRMSADEIYIALINIENSNVKYFIKTTLHKRHNLAKNIGLNLWENIGYKFAIPAEYILPGIYDIFTICIKEKSLSIFENRKKISFLPKHSNRSINKQKINRNFNFNKATILIIEHAIPQYDKNAGDLTIYQYIKLFLSLNFNVVFIPDNREPIEPYTKEIKLMGVKVIDGYFNFEGWIKSNGKFFDYVLTCRPDIAVKYIDLIRLNSGAKILYYTHDLHFLRELRIYELSGENKHLIESTKLKELELEIFSKVDVVLTPSSSEEIIIRELSPGVNAVTIPPYIYKEDDAKNVLNNIEFKDRKGLLFLGGFKHAPNEDSIIWFVNEIFPLVRKILSDVNLYIAGSDVTQNVYALEASDIKVVGYVQDLSSLFNRIKVFVAPLRYGAGVKGKIVSSLFYGVPVVTTTIGNEGLNLINGEQAFIADTPAKIAEYISKLYLDEKLWKLFSNAGIDFVKDNFSTEVARKALFKALDLPVDINNNAKEPENKLQTDSAKNKKTERIKNNNFNILYFSPFPSHPQNHGNRSTIYRFGLKFKELGCKVHYVLHSNLNESLSLKELDDMKSTWDTVDEIPSFVNEEAVRNDDGIPFDGWYQEGLGEEIASLCAKYDIDIVLCTYIFSSKLLEYVPDYILKIIDTHDKFGNRFEGLRRHGVPLEFFSCTPEDEGTYLRRADIVLSRRDEESDYFNKVSGKETAITIPHLQEPKFIVRDFNSLKNIGIVMSPNFVNLKIIADFIAAINFYIKENTPPPFIIHITGDIKNLISALPMQIRQIFNKQYIYLHGFLPNIEEFYSKMDLVAAPITFGTGINVKCVEAMAYGLPLLTTKIGSKGIDTDEPLHKLENIEELVKSLFMLTAEPAGLNLLAASSRAAYSKFYDKSLQNFKTIFNHPKLKNNS